jgi:hypothetical protein
VATKTKKAAQAVRYFLSVYYYKNAEGAGLLGRFFHKNLFGQRPTNEWLIKAIGEAVPAATGVTIVVSVMISKEEYEYQQTPTTT